MDTRGKRLLAVIVLSAAPLLGAVPAQAMWSGGHECFRAPCPTTAPVVVQTTGHYAHIYEARGWTCVHVKGRQWACTNLRSQSRARL